LGKSAAHVADTRSKFERFAYPRFGGLSAVELTNALARIQIPAPEVDMTPVLAANEKLAEQQPRKWIFKTVRNAAGGIREVVATTRRLRVSAITALTLRSARHAVDIVVVEIRLVDQPMRITVSLGSNTVVAMRGSGLCERRHHRERHDQGWRPSW